jgi:D-aminoacyl-tRNA deacylase
MRVLLQRVSSASVTVGGELVGEIGPGFLLLVGIGQEDTAQDVDTLAVKISRLRIFSDENGKMNLDLEKIGGQILSVSQFTLYADLTRGNRPGFSRAASPEEGKRLWEAFNAKLLELGFEVKTGIFGADMKVKLVNDGPVTMMLDSQF